MMSYKNGFIAAIKVDGKVLREKADIMRNTSERTVFLPYDSEYAIFLKNNNSNRCLVHIDIDGMDALGGQGFILNGYQSFDLERFILDGDLDKGRKFKFVRLDHPDVVDPSSKDNGLIIIKFTEEKTDTSWIWYDAAPWTQPIPWNPWKISGSGQNTLYSASVGSKGSRSMGFMDTGSVEVKCSSDQAGATVEGSESRQKFGTASFGNHGETHEVRIRLRARKSPLLVRDTKYVFCQSCGRKNAYTSNYCSKCGTKLEK